MFQQLAVNIAMVSAAAAALFLTWWNVRVRKIRSQFINKTTGKQMPGSNNPPMIDYFIYGFDGRNQTAPFGDFELSFMLGFPIVMVSEPNIIKELMKGNGVKDYDKGEMTLAGVEVIAGRQNLFSLDGLDWHHLRGIINPAFRPAVMRLLTSAIVSTTQDKMSKWKMDGKFPDDISSAINNLTLDIICRSAFGGIENDGSDNHPVLFLYEDLMKNLIWKTLGLGFFFASEKKIANASDGINQIALKVLENCRANKSLDSSIQTTSLISLLLASESSADTYTDVGLPRPSTNTSSKLTDQQIIDNIKIFLFAGHDSTATTIIWVLYMLALHPAYDAQILTELPATSSTCTYDTLHALTVLQCVLKETLRLFPPAWTINRSPKTHDCVLGGYSVPKGTAVMINTLRLHRREDIGWDRPLEFIPERWLPENAVSSVHQLKSSFCYLPFGGGPRTCVGQPLAELEMLTVLSHLLLEYRPTVIGGVKENGWAINYFAGATIRPKNVANLRLIARK